MIEHVIEEKACPSETKPKNLRQVQQYLRKIPLYTLDDLFNMFTFLFNIRIEIQDSIFEQKKHNFMQ